MLISIVVPVFNLEDYIVRTLDSIFAQTYRDIEVIAVDDGSADNTPAILDEYAAGESRLKVIHKQNEGVSKARLSGIEAASGEYIGFVDGDDIVDPDMYERLLGNALKYGADISHCGYRMIKPGGSVEYFYNTGALIIQDNEQGISNLLDGSKIEPGLWNKLCRADLVRNVLLNPKMDFSLKNNEDLLMNYFLFKESKKSVFEDFCPYCYIVRENSASKSSISSHRLSDPVRAAEIIFEDIENNRKLCAAAARLYGIKLVSAATYGGKKNEEIDSAVKFARKKLRNFLPVYIKTISSRIDIIKTVFAACFPSFYSAVHAVYLSRRK